MKVIFINYGLFESNSGGHIAHFANHLSNFGHSVAVCASGPTAGLSAYGTTQFEPIQTELLDFDPSAVAAFDGKPATPFDTIVHCWTPRERVRLLTERLRSLGPIPYVVHLEDNEEVVASSQLQRPWREILAQDEDQLRHGYPLGLSHPHNYKRFLGGSAGVTVIIDTLKEFVPDGIPAHLLQPGVDTKKFSPNNAVKAKSKLKRELGLDPDSKIIVYHGNMHAANQREIFSLYCAVAILRRRGVKITLLRAGRDYSPGVDLSFSHLSAGVLSLGYLDDGRLLEILKLADAYVQPGAADEFNIYRLPSKLPEFFSLGRPVLLPAANIALQLEDGRDAILLKRGDGTDIADRLMEVFGDPIAAKAMGQRSRRFAQTHLRWIDKAKDLELFYDTVLANHRLA